MICCTSRGSLRARTTSSAFTATSRQASLELPSSSPEGTRSLCPTSFQQYQGTEPGAVQNEGTGAAR